MTDLRILILHLFHTAFQYIQAFFNACPKHFLSFLEIGIERMQAIVCLEEELFAVFSDEQSLRLASICAVISRGIEAYCTRGKV